MVRFSRLAAFSFLIAATSTSPDAWAEKSFRLAAEGLDAKGKPVPIEELSFEASGVRLTSRLLDASAAKAALSAAVGRDVELFRDRTATSRGHLVFALEISNSGAGDLIFEPGQTRLLTDRSDAEFPLEYSSLYEMTAALGAGAPTLEEIEKGVFARAVSIGPGGAVRKLLVFPAPRDPKFKKMEIRVGALHQSGGDLDAVFRYRNFKEKK